MLACDFLNLYVITPPSDGMKTFGFEFQWWETTCNNEMEEKGAGLSSLTVLQSHGALQHRQHHRAGIIV